MVAYACTALSYMYIQLLRWSKLEYLSHTIHSKLCDFPISHHSCTLSRLRWGAGISWQLFLWLLLRFATRRVDVDEPTASSCTDTAFYHRLSLASSLVSPYCLQLVDSGSDTESFKNLTGTTSLMSWHFYCS